MSNADLAGLNRCHGILDELVFKESPSGLILAEINNSHAKATLTLQGAQVTSWTPVGQHPVIWLSPATPFVPGLCIRGGIPVCWPWFGPHAHQPDYPAHGFARTTPWEVIASDRLEDGRTHLALRMITSDSTMELWPHQTPVELHLTVGANLEIELCTQNIGPAPIRLVQALHTYFTVSDIRHVSVQGLDNLLYIDKVNHDKLTRQQGPVRFEGETDRIYLDSVADCLIDDPGLRRRLRIAKRGSLATVVWNPWVEKSARLSGFEPDGYLGMLCVESANTDHDSVILPSNGKHVLSVSYSVETLD